MMYPLARAFGGPRESQLKVCRAAFDEMKATVAQRQVLVAAPLVVRRGEPSWDPASLQTLTEAVRRDLSRTAAEAPEIPAVAHEPMARNQMRYAWNRAYTYEEWVRSLPDAQGFWLFTEVFADGEGTTIHGGQMYVIDASGRIAYVSWLNSHHFDQTEVVGVEAFTELLLKCLVSDLEKEAKEIFPPYYVG